MLRLLIMTIKLIKKKEKKFKILVLLRLEPLILDPQAVALPIRIKYINDSEISELLLRQTAVIHIDHHLEQSAKEFIMIKLYFNKLISKYLHAIVLFILMTHTGRTHQDMP